MGATNRFQLLVEAQARGDEELKRLEKSLKSIETTSRTVRNSFIAITATATAAGAALTSASTGMLAFAKANLVAESGLARTLGTFRALRVAAAIPAGGAALGFAVGSAAGGIVLQKLAHISNENAKLIERNALLAAQTGRSFGSVQTFGTASTISGRDLSGLSAFNPDDVRKYIAELEKIPDPIERARRAQELFGKESGAAYALLGTNVGRIIASSQELTQQLDFPTRTSVQRLRDDFKAFEEFSPFDRAKESLIQFREEAKQGITVKVAGVLDFIRGLGNRLPGAEGGGAGGAEGGVGFDSGNRPGLGVPTLDEFRRMALDVIGTSKRFRTDDDGKAIGPAASLLPSADRGGLGLGQAFRSGAGGTEDSILAALKDVQTNRQKLRTILGTPGLGDADFKDINVRLNKLASQEVSLQEAADRLAKARKGAILNVDSTTFITPQSTRVPSLRGVSSLPDLPEFVSKQADRDAANPFIGDTSAGFQQEKDKRERELNASFARQFVQFEEQRINLLTGPGGELEAINKIYELKKSGLEQELQYGNEIFNLTERRLQIEQDRTLKIIELQRQRKEEARALASDFVGSLQAGRPGDFFKQQGGRLINQIGTNALTGTFQKVQSTLGGFGAASGFGGLLKGTLLDPSNATPIGKVATATERTAIAAERTANILEGRGPGGVAVPGAGVGLPGGFNALAALGPASGFTSGFNGTNGLSRNIAQIGTGLGSVLAQGGLFAGLREGSIQQGPGFATTREGLGLTSTTARAANVTGSIAALGTGALTAIRGFKEGGAAGITQGITATLGTAALIPGPQQPFIAAAAATAALVGMLLPDPKKAREASLNNLLNSSIYEEATPMQFNLDRLGRGYDTNKRGEYRSTGDVNIYIDALDSKSIFDRKEDIADAMRGAIYEGHGVNRAMQEAVLAM